MQAYNFVPRALFPGFGGWAQSQGKAPWGRGWQALSGASRTPRSQTFVQTINFCAKSSAVVICKHTWRSQKLGYLWLELALAELDSKNAGRFFFPWVHPQMVGPTSFPGSLIFPPKRGRWETLGTRLWSAMVLGVPSGDRGTGDIDCLQSAFSLKIRLVLISSSAIANHDVVSWLNLPLTCLGFACSNLATKNKRLLAVYWG